MDDTAPVGALWHFRYRWRTRPHLFSTLAVGGSGGAAELASEPPGLSGEAPYANVEVDGPPARNHVGVRADVARTSAGWEDPADRGATLIHLAELDTKTASADETTPTILEWDTDAVTPAGHDGDAALVAVLHGFAINAAPANGSVTGVAVSRLGIWAEADEADGRIRCGLVLGGRGPVRLTASMQVALLSVPRTRLRVETPTAGGRLHGGIEPHHPPLAASFGNDKLRPLGIGAVEWDLSSGRHLGRPTARPLRELGVTISGLVLRWHISTASVSARPATVQASATVPCVVTGPNA